VGRGDDLAAPNASRPIAIWWRHCGTNATVVCASGPFTAA
jgi:hypothetical protein